MAKTGGQEHAIIALIDNRFVKKGVDGKGESREEVVEVVQFKTTPAVVRRGMGLTLNLGNYESARLDVSIEVPCYLEDIENADAFARKWVEDRVVQEVESVRGKSDDKPVF